MLIMAVPTPCEVRLRLTIPVFASQVPAGFPSPAEDYLDQPLDFNELLIAHPAATFAVRIASKADISSVCHRPSS